MSLSSATLAALDAAGLDPAYIEDLVSATVEEDLDGGVDVTSVATVPPDQRSVLDLVARATGVAAGVPVAAAVFDLVSEGDAEVLVVASDGSRVQRGDVLLARLGGALLGAVDDLVRLPAGLLQGGEPLLLGGLPVATGLLGVLQSLLDALPALVQGLAEAGERELADQEEEQDERRARDDDPEQVDLERFRSRLAALSCERGGLTGAVTDEGEDLHGRRLRGEDREETDDDREHAKALGEGRQDDGETADLPRCVRVAADRAARHAGEDADADAGAKDAESGDAGANRFHRVRPSIRPGGWPGSGA